MFLWAVRTGDSNFQFETLALTSLLQFSILCWVVCHWSGQSVGSEAQRPWLRQVMLRLSPWAALKDRPFVTEAQDFTFFHNECRLVPLVPVLKSWGLWLSFSLSVHSFPWPASALHKKHPSINNFKRFISHAAIPLCGGNGTETGLSTIWQNRKKKLVLIFSLCSP